ncbi:MAG: isoamylase early set domain-containing protein [Planctomycetes bacterium]|nr:isoamylase early set domain-containing protein [Planctomycetota bacterium]
MVARINRNELEFRFYRPRAHEVFLVGDFSGWDQRAHPMTRSEDGEWCCRLELCEGVYQFKYLADGAWYVDYAAFGVEPCPFGHNSVMVVDDVESPAVPLG